jgi:hypothetical protein
MAACVAAEDRCPREFLDKISLASAQTVYARFDALWTRGKTEDRSEQEFLLPYVLMHESKAERVGSGL